MPSRSTSLRERSAARKGKPLRKPRGLPVKSKRKKPVPSSSSRRRRVVRDYSDSEDSVDSYEEERRRRRRRNKAKSKKKVSRSSRRSKRDYSDESEEEDDEISEGESDDYESPKFQKRRDNVLVRKHGGPKRKSKRDQEEEEEEDDDEEGQEEEKVGENETGIEGEEEAEEGDEEESEKPKSVEEKASNEEAVVKSSDVLEIVGKEVGDRVIGSQTRVGQGSGGDYGAAYRELYEQLCSRMVHRIMRFFIQLYARVGDPDKFKVRLVEIQRWNQDQINKVAKGFVRNNRDIIRVFRFAYAADVLVMSVVVQRDEGSTDVEVDCPKFSDFCHRCFIETARNIFNHVGILDPKLSPSEKIQVHEALYLSTSRAIASSLRMMVPIHKIAPVHEEDEEQYDIIDGTADTNGLDLDEEDMNQFSNQFDNDDENMYPARLDDDKEDDEEETEQKEKTKGGKDDDSQLDSDEEDEADSDEDSDEEEEDSEEEDSEEESDSEEEESSDDEQPRSRRERYADDESSDDGQLQFF